MQLTKHHGLANDFLVLVDLDGDHPIDAELARLACDRHRGIGADGLIRIGAGTDGADLTMDLLNSDGSPAEMSGNGMRCLAQAAVMAGAVTAPSFTVATGGGVRRVVHRVGDRPGESWVAVDMGPITPDASPVDAIDHDVEPQKAVALRIGNPHLVLLVDDVASIDIARLGPRYEDQVVGGTNVEWIQPDAGGAVDTITMRVWERGAGITQACGTGACAAARAAHDWGVVGDHVRVDMPGGTVEVDLGASVTLSGPAAYIGTIELDPAFLRTG